MLLVYPLQPLLPGRGLPIQHVPYFLQAPEANKAPISRKAVESAQILGIAQWARFAACRASCTVFVVIECSCLTLRWKLDHFGAARNRCIGRQRTAPRPDRLQAHAAKLEGLHLRPCEHQVAGHLFEDGKAGSLVDDRGHFYKPLQRGPRGDRERAFYDAIEAALHAEKEASAAAVAGPQQCGAADRTDVGAAGVEATALAAAACCGRQQGSAAGALPWKHRDLRHLFPSFSDSVKEQVPMAVTQRDELGLLSSLILAKLSAESGAREQQHAQSPTLVQTQTRTQLAQGQHPLGASDLEEDDLVHQYGKSPDSDDCAELTGRHLMHSFHCASDSSLSDRTGGADSDSGAAVGTTGADRLWHQAGTAAAATEAHTQVQVHLSAGDGMQPVQQHCGCPAQQQAQQLASAGQASAQASAASRGQQLSQQQCSTGGGSSWERRRRHSAPSAEEAYTSPEHAQAAALLGQPVFDRSLSVTSTSMPWRSPFMSVLPHHTHPPGLQEAATAAASATAAAATGAAADEQQRQQRGEAAVAGAARGASRGLADALARLPGLGSPRGGRSCSSGAAHWLAAEQQQQDHPSQMQQQQSSDRSKACTSNTISCDVCASAAATYGSLPFSVRNAPLLRVIPKYYGVAPHQDGRTLLELEDLARAYRRPCIMDIKVGFRTWYPQADEAYIQRCREKDESTTQAALGFKICGMQVYRHGAGGYWRASKRWCKTLPVDLVDKALLSFAHNEHGLRPADVYGGRGGAIEQLEALAQWFTVQQDFHFYSSSVLLLYEGSACSPADARVRVRLVDFAHTFQTQAPDAERDHNFLAGLRALLARLHGVVHSQLQQQLA